MEYKRGPFIHESDNQLFVKGISIHLICNEKQLTTKMKKKTATEERNLTLQNLCIKNSK